MEGDYPLGTDTCVLVVQEEHDRRLITPEAAAEHGEDARPWLPRGTDRGRKVTAAFADDSHRFTAAIQAVSPPARLHADPCHTVKQSWGHRKKSRLSSRRPIKARGADKKAAPLLAFAQQLWPLRWRLRKKPGHVSVEDKQALAELESADEGLVPRFRRMIRQLVHMFAQAHSEAHAQLRLHQRRQDIHVLADRHRAQMPQCLEAHWEPALRYLRHKGLGTPRRGSNSASRRRLLRRRERNHEGVRSAATRSPSMQISQARQSLSLDVAAFLEKGPQLAELPDV
jgi:hypothetical protein